MDGRKSKKSTSDLSAATVRQKWKTYLTVRKRMKKKPPIGTAADEMPQNCWKFYEWMSFLEGIEQTHSTSSYYCNFGLALGRGSSEDLCPSPETCFDGNLSESMYFMLQVCIRAVHENPLIWANGDNRYTDEIRPITPLMVPPNLSIPPEKRWIKWRKGLVDSCSSDLY